MNNLRCLQLFESQECYQHVCSFSCLFLRFRNPKKYEFIELTTVRRGLHNGVIGARLTLVKGNAILCTDLHESLFKENYVFKSFESLSPRVSRHPYDDPLPEQHTDQLIYSFVRHGWGLMVRISFPFSVIVSLGKAFYPHCLIWKWVDVWWWS